PDLGWRWPSRLVATAAEDRLTDATRTSFAAASDCRTTAIYEYTPLRCWRCTPPGRRRAVTDYPNPTSFRNDNGPKFTNECAPADDRSAMRNSMARQRDTIKAHAATKSRN